MIKIFDGKKESAYLMRKTADINILGKCAGAGEGAGSGNEATGESSRSFEPIYIFIDQYYDYELETYSWRFDEWRFTEEVKSAINRTVYGGCDDPNFQIAFAEAGQYGFATVYPATEISSTFTGEITIRANVSDTSYVSAYRDGQDGPWSIGVYERPKGLPMIGYGAAGYVLKLDENLEWVEAPPVAGTLTPNEVFMHSVSFDDANENNVALTSGVTLYYQQGDEFYADESAIASNSTYRFVAYDGMEEDDVDIFDEYTSIYTDHVDEGEARVVYAWHSAYDYPEIAIVYAPYDDCEFDGIAFPTAGFYVNKSFCSRTIAEGANVLVRSRVIKLDPAYLSDNAVVCDSDKTISVDYKINGEQVFMYSPNGTKYKLAVDDSGALTAVEVTE